MTNKELFDYIKTKYNQDFAKNKLVYNLSEINIKDVFALVEIFESFTNNDETRVKRLINKLSANKKEEIKQLLQHDHVLVAVVGFVKSKITSKELLGYFNHNKNLKDGL